MKKNRALGIILIIIAILLPIISNIVNNYEESIQKEKVLAYFEETTTINEDKNVPNKIIKDDKHNYIAILEIPAISLKRGLVSINNKYNDIAYNIAILETSEMPDIPNSNLILASHNGNSDVSFFKDLEKLTINNKVYLYYNGYRYGYEVANYYTVKKTGKVNINRDTTKNTITLITCKNNSNDEQIVYIAYFIDKKSY